VKREREGASIVYAPSRALFCPGDK